MRVPVAIIKGECRDNSGSRCRGNRHEYNRGGLYLVYSAFKNDL